MRKVIRSIICIMAIQTFIISATEAALVTDGDENNFVTKAEVFQYEQEFQDMLKEADKQTLRKVTERMQIYKISPSEAKKE